VAPPELPSASGTADFDYLSHDGRYIIGTGHYMFETRWTSGPWLYNDPPSISGIATTEAHEITDILDASTADFTSWARSVREGTVVVLKNMNGCYAVLKIRAVQDARMVFDYVIKPDHTTNFSEG